MTVLDPGTVASTPADAAPMLTVTNLTTTFRVRATAASLLRWIGSHGNQAKGDTHDCGWVETS